jgi:hypothetical protein
MFCLANARLAHQQNERGCLHDFLGKLRAPRAAAAFELMREIVPGIRR